MGVTGHADKELARRLPNDLSPREAHRKQNLQAMLCCTNNKGHQRCTATLRS